MVYMYVTLLLNVSAYGSRLEGGGYKRKEYILLNTCRYEAKTRVLNKITLKNVCSFGNTKRFHMHLSTFFLSDAHKHHHQKYPSFCSVCPYVDVILHAATDKLHKIRNQNYFQFANNFYKP
jgi:hypothetical protein